MKKELTHYQLPQAKEFSNVIFVAKHFIITMILQNLEPQLHISKIRQHYAVNVLISLMLQKNCLNKLTFVWKMQNTFLEKALLESRMTHTNLRF